jgi:Helicase conserved C-terminal domain
VQLVMQETWTETSRGIIFCLSQTEVDTLAAFFGNTKYHSDMTLDDRMESQEKWNKNFPGHQWMVAMTGFIQGIDNSNVDTVIFLEMPYGLTNFVQSGGRAERSGAPAHVFLIDYCITFISPPANTIDPAGIIPGTRYVESGSECRQLILSDVMDGQPVRCADLHNAASCDNCNPNHPLVVASKKLLQPVHDPSPDYDIGGWDDTTLALLDESVLDPTPPSSGPSTQVILSQKKIYHLDPQCHCIWIMPCISGYSKKKRQRLLSCQL